MKRVSGIIFLSFFAFNLVVNAQVKFNEVVSSNSIFLDEDGDSPDWIELKNFSSGQIDLSSWYLSDDRNNLAKWKLPEFILDSSEISLIWASDKDRIGGGVAAGFVNQGDDFKWIIPEQSTSVNWNMPNFDDSNWREGKSGFGYGDGDDETILDEGTISVFVRKTFHLTDVNAISALFLFMDYDDAFVAYINGHEVARANIEGNPPAYNRESNGDHEAIIYNGGVPERFEIEDYADLLKEGENVLAIQGHNVHDASSDFTLIPFLAGYLSTTSEMVRKPDELLAIIDIGFHTNFKIANGETLFLSDPQLFIRDSIYIDSLPGGISFGIPSTGHGLVYFDEPTPGMPNKDEGFIGILDPDINFSHQGGLTAPLGLNLSGNKEDEVIRFTSDATVPDEESPIYSYPLEINSNTVIRARIFKDGYLPSQVQSKSYIINKSHLLPVITLVTEPEDFFDSEEGIYVLGEGYQGQFPYFGSNIWEDVEKPIQFSIYKPDGALGASFNAGVKIFGGWSRALDQRSLSLFARKRYGDDEFKYPFFQNREFDEFQALVLRNSGNDFLWANMRDGLMTTLLDDADIEIQAYQPVVTYLNRDYWGVYNLREKINEHFIDSRFDINLDSLDLLEMNGIVIYGKNNDYLELLDYLGGHSLSSAENYQYVTDRIDIDNYILYQLSQIYFDNRDWPGNNVKFWKANGGKWRWILFDTDFGFGIWDPNKFSFNTLSYSLSPSGPAWPNPPWSTFLFRKMVENETFRKKFINQFADELNSRFLASEVMGKIDSLASNIEEDIIEHYFRWYGNPSQWYREVETMRNFANRRPSFIKSHIINTFSLNKYHKIIIQNEDPEMGYVQLNSLSIKEDIWGGDYFQDVPITITAIPKPGFEFSHWTGGSASTNAQIIHNPIQAETFIPIFKISESASKNLVINEINFNSADHYDTGDWVEIHNPNQETWNIAGFRIMDSKNRDAFEFPEGSIIQGKSFIVICQDQAIFKSLHVEPEFVFGNLEFGFSGTQDSVRLFNANGELLDMVAYSEADNWPLEVDVVGGTLELIDPSLDNSKPENWANINRYGSPGRANVAEETDADFKLWNIQWSPNPFREDVELTFEVIEPVEIKASLYNSNGQLIRPLFESNFESGGYRYSWNFGDLSQGIYMLRFLIDGKSSKTIKWVRI